MKILKPLGEIFPFSLHCGFHTAAMQSTPTPSGRSEALLASGVTALLGLLVWFTVLDGWRSAPFRGLLRDLPQSDKIGHFAIYGSIALFAALLAKHPARIRMAAAAVMLVGIVDEFRQLGEFGRTYSLGDIVANGLGILAGVTVAKIILHWRQRHEGPIAVGIQDEPTPAMR